jgi:hypothetical protein
MARLQMSDLKTDDQPRSPDDDLALLLNLIWTPRGRYVHATYSRAPDSPRRTGRITIVGGSFMHALDDLWEETEAFERISFYYYYKVSLFSFPGGQQRPIDESQINWPTDFEQADAVILEINESAVGWNHPRAFLDGALASLPARPGASEIRASFDSNTWHPEEKSQEYCWHWSKGDANISLTNPTGTARTAILLLKLISNRHARTVCLFSPGKRLIWQGMVKPDELFPVPALRIELPPGHSELVFTSDVPAESASEADSRALAFAVYDLSVSLEPLK